jgi:hypothetical protein
MFWERHVAIVVVLKPARGGDTWIVYADAGRPGAELVGVNAKWSVLAKTERDREGPQGAVGHTSVPGLLDRVMRRTRQCWAVCV